MEVSEKGSSRRDQDTHGANSLNPGMVMDYLFSGGLPCAMPGALILAASTLVLALCGGTEGATITGDSEGIRWAVHPAWLSPFLCSLRDLILWFV